jgi:hypothetical protein
MAPGIVPGGCDTWEHVFEFEQTTVRKGSAASTQCRTSLRTRDFVRQAGQSPTRPRPGEVDQVHPGKLPRVTGGLPRACQGLTEACQGPPVDERGNVAPLCYGLHRRSEPKP